MLPSRRADELIMKFYAVSLSRCSSCYSWWGVEDFVIDFGMKLLEVLFGCSAVVFGVVLRLRAVLIVIFILAAVRASAAHRPGHLPLIGVLTGARRHSVFLKSTQYVAQQMSY